VDVSAQGQESQPGHWWWVKSGDESALPLSVFECRAVKFEWRGLSVSNACQYL